MAEAAYAAGPALLGAPLFEASIFTFWGLTFSGDLGLFGASR
jgi:hypothetical protein